MFSKAALKDKELAEVELQNRKLFGKLDKEKSERKNFKSRKLWQLQSL
jgi:hypothetical protein